MVSALIIFDKAPYDVCKVHAFKQKWKNVSSYTTTSSENWWLTLRNLIILDFWLDFGGLRCSQRWLLDSKCLIFRWVDISPPITFTRNMIIHLEVKDRRRLQVWLFNLLRYLRSIAVYLKSVAQYDQSHIVLHDIVSVSSIEIP